MEITHEKIKEEVEKYFPETNLSEKGNRQGGSCYKLYPVHVYHYLVKELIGNVKENQKEKITKRDRTTVVCSHKKIKELIGFDKQTTMDINNLLEKLNPSRMIDLSYYFNSFWDTNMSLDRILSIKKDTDIPKPTSHITETYNTDSESVFRIKNLKL